MSYKAIYRRFRPETFDDLVGQDNVVRILKNQVKSNNIAHAYLFSGIRGTGKTSAAKIFARAVNCLNPQDGNPCNECEICKGILNESIMDIVEIDAASNNKVDDIRELKENSNYPPSNARFKVYIVDEVHMLSKGAFNAFLKTLEEPPGYVIFILATTEENKIPATILSRCQRYEFKRITSDDIVKNMEKICGEIGVEAEKSALKLIARNSGGGMRDALSILDQCLANTGNSLTLEDVIESIGSVDMKFLRETASDIINGDTANIVYKFDRLMKSGKDYNVFLKELISFFRDMMIIKTGVRYEDILEISDEEIEEMKNISEDISSTEIISYIERLAEIEDSMKETNQPRTILEVSLIKLAETERDEDLLLRIKKLEEIIESGNFTRAAKISSSKRKPETVSSEDDRTEKSDSGKLVPPIKASEKPQPQKSVSEDTVENMDSHTESSESETASSDSLTFNEISGRWDDFIKFLRKVDPRMSAFLVEGKVRAFNNGMLKISYGDSFGFHKEAVSRKENIEELKKLLKKFFHCEMEVNIVMESDEVLSQSPDISGEHEVNDNREADEIPIQEIFDIFGDEKVIIE